MVEEYDCKKCGACCAMFCSTPKGARPVVNLALLGRDLERMPEKLRRKLVRIDTIRDGHPVKTEFRLPAVPHDDGAICAFFKGEVGSSCRCSIYKYRPFHCRYFTPDIDYPSCRLARSAFGLEKVATWVSPWEVERMTPMQQKRIAPYLLVGEGKLKKGLVESKVPYEIGEVVCDESTFVGLR